MYNDTTSLSNLQKGYLHMLRFVEIEKKKERKILTDSQINPVFWIYDTCTAESEKVVSFSNVHFKLLSS